jgi:hypothetical protein
MGKRESSPFSLSLEEKKKKEKRKKEGAVFSSVLHPPGFLSKY